MLELLGSSPGPESRTATSTCFDSAMPERINNSRGPSPSSTHGFDGVHHQIENHLLQLDSICENERHIMHII